MNYEQDVPVFDAQEDNPVQRLEYRQNANAEKIQKISRRVTLVSVLIPILSLAFLGFVYLDIRERVISSDSSKQDQMKAVSTQMTEKLNSLDTRLARNRQTLDQQLPQIMASAQELSDKIHNAEEQAKKLESRLGSLEKSRTVLDKDITDLQASRKNIADQLHTMEIIIKKNTEKNTVAFETIERINKSLLLSMDDAIVEVQKDLQALNEQIQNLKKDNKETVLTAQQFETRIKELKTQMDGSIEDLDGQIKRVKISVSALASNLANRPVASTSGPRQGQAPEKKSAPSQSEGKIATQALNQ